MTESELLFVSQTLLASALYYGIAGGVIGYVVASLVASAGRFLLSFARRR